MDINLKHKKMNTTQCYEKLKELNKKYPGYFMDANEWLKQHEKLKEND